MPLEHIDDKPLKFYETTEFKDLNKKWHDKLEDRGFYDFEEFDSPMQLMKTHENERFRIKFTGDEFIARQRYYELAGQLLHDYHFRTQRDEKIWRLHCEGNSEKLIAETVKQPLNKVKTFIRELRKRIVK